MAQSSFFGGKRDTDTPAVRPAHGYGSPVGTHAGGNGLAGAQPFSNSSPAAVAAAETPKTAEGGGSKLTVGPNIKLKGVEITDCDTLVVEGLVEATMDSRVIQISEQGAFKGSADIDIAEIHGVFEGNLTVREKLVIYSSGRVSGKIRYGKVVIEEGGQIEGEISSNASTGRATQGASSSAATSSAKASGGIQAVAA